MHYITCNTAVLSLSSFVGRQEYLGGTGTTPCPPSVYAPGTEVAAGLLWIKGS